MADGGRPRGGPALARVLPLYHCEVDLSHRSWMGDDRSNDDGYRKFQQDEAPEEISSD